MLWGKLLINATYGGGVSVLTIPPGYVLLESRTQGLFASAGLPTPPPCPHSLPPVLAPDPEFPSLSGPLSMVRQV